MTTAAVNFAAPSPGYPDVEGVSIDERRRVFALLWAFDKTGPTKESTPLAAVFEEYLKTGKVPTGNQLKVIDK